MSRDVVSIPVDATPHAARSLLLQHNIRALPVTERDGLLMGTVGLRELASETVTLAEMLSPAAAASPSELALSLLPTLTDGRSHAVVIIDPDRKVLGMITQTDLLAASARLLKAP